MDKTDIFIFDVGLGQSIFIYPHSHPTYGMLVDCGNTEEFEPIDFLLEKGFLPDNVLSNLTLTNYDQDHFSGMPNLLGRIGLHTVTFAPNLSSSEIKELKEEPHTEALKQVCRVKDTYIDPVPGYAPPYSKQTFYLQREHLENPDADNLTNNLSQIVFIEQHGTVVCISGDLEEGGWKLLLEKEPVIKTWLARTNIFIASHHGRDNGYYPAVFSHCKPECIVISDKGIMHDTQRDMSAVYGNHVVGGGVIFNGNLSNKRKVLTTRDSGHLWIQLSTGGGRAYRNFSHE